MSIIIPRTWCKLLSVSVGKHIRYDSVHLSIMIWATCGLQKPTKQTTNSIQINVNVYISVYVVCVFVNGLYTFRYPHTYASCEKQSWHKYTIFPLYTPVAIYVRMVDRSRVYPELSVIVCGCFVSHGGYTTIPERCTYSGGILYGYTSIKVNPYIRFSVTHTFPT